MEKIVSVYWFAILVIVAGGIVAMVLIFYGEPFDVREAEANVMMNQIADCLSDNGQLKYSLNDDLRNNFLSLCHINLETEEEENHFYIGLNFYDFSKISGNSLGENFFNFYQGNPNLKENQNTNSLFSLEKSFYVLNMEGKSPREIAVQMTIIIDKNNKNA